MQNTDNVQNKDRGNLLEKPLTPTMEDYLEAIFNLSKEKRVVRVKDIAKRLGIKMPTVTSMLKTLSKRGLIDYEKYEYLELTGKGHAVGKETRRGHEVLRSFLTDILKIDFDRANREACKMEHAISSSTLDRFSELMEFLRVCPRAGWDWLEHSDRYRLHDMSEAERKEQRKRFIDECYTKLKAMEIEKRQTRKGEKENAHPEGGK